MQVKFLPLAVTFLALTMGTRAVGEEVMVESDAAREAVGDNASIMNYSLLDGMFSGVSDNSSINATRIYLENNNQNKDAKAPAGHPHLPGADSDASNLSFTIFSLLAAAMVAASGYVYLS